MIVSLPTQYDCKTLHMAMLMLTWFSTTCGLCLFFFSSFFLHIYQAKGNFDLQGVTLQTSYTSTCMLAHVLPSGIGLLCSWISVPGLEDVYLSDEAANRGYWGFWQNHCSCSHILLWYYSSFDATPSGLGLHFAFKRAKKSPVLLWSRDSGLKQHDLCLQGRHKNMRLPSATTKSKSIRWRRFTGCKHTDLWLHLVVERHSI